jgi:hypothetical protein
LLYASGGILDSVNEMTGAISKASGIRAEGKFEEQAFFENARRLDLAADNALKRGKKAAHDFLVNVKQHAGTQKATMAAQGIETSGGSAEAVLAETIDLGIEDSATIRVNSYTEAFGFKSQASEARTQSSLTRISRKSREKSALLTGRLRTLQAGVSAGVSINQAGSA